MARTRGYTRSIVAQLTGQGKIEKKGIVPPEELGMQYIFRFILEQLSKESLKSSDFIWKHFPHFCQRILFMDTAWKV